MTELNLDTKDGWILTERMADGALYLPGLVFDALNGKLPDINETSCMYGGTLLAIAYYKCDYKLAKHILANMPYVIDSRRNWSIMGAEIDAHTTQLRINNCNCVLCIQTRLDMKDYDGLTYCLDKIPFSDERVIPILEDIMRYNYMNKSASFNIPINWFRHFYKFSPRIRYMVRDLTQSQALYILNLLIEDNNEISRYAIEIYISTPYGYTLYMAGIKHENWQKYCPYLDKLPAYWCEVGDKVPRKPRRFGTTCAFIIRRTR